MEGKTVEELLAGLLRVDKTPLYCAGGECGFTEGKHISTRAELEELFAEGVAEGHHDGFHEGYREGAREGAEQERERLAFIQDDDRSEGKYPVVEQIERIGSLLVALDEDTRLTVREMLHNLADVARVDGRNQEKECIRRALDPCSASVLAPTKEKP